MAACRAAAATDLASSVTTVAAMPEVDGRYREEVIAAAAKMHEKGELTARTAYEAVDGGADSQAARDLGGLDRAEMWVDRFERWHDYRPLRSCVETHAASLPDSKAIYASIASGGHASKVISTAQRLAPQEFEALDVAAAGGVDQPELVRTLFAFSVLETRSGAADVVDPERIGIETTALLARGTGGACQPSLRLAAFIANLP